MTLYPVKTLVRPTIPIAIVALFGGCPPVLDTDLTPQPAAEGQHLLRLVHITDPQIVDEESPARAVRFSEFSSGAWRPQEAFGVHTLDATLQAINRLHEAGATTDRPVDFVVVTGDLADSAQHNELQWFLDTMDGAVVTPDSGVLDGVDRAVPPELNPKLAYDAVGLDRDIPWYTCFGNHDGLAVGNFPINRDPLAQNDWFAPLLAPVAQLLGFHELALDNNAMRATDNWSPIALLGSGVPVTTPNYRLDYARVSPGAIIPDGARRFLSKEDFIALHLASESTPTGHGFTQESRQTGATYYSVRPLPDVPLRLIVFDSVADNKPYGIPAYFGVLERAHFEQFILPELAAAAEAEEWVILASHHPASDFDLGLVGDRVRAGEFRTAVAQYPNVIMHLNGHTHIERADIVRGANPYLEISTSAIIDYPQEGRALDIFLEADAKTIRVESHRFSHRDAPTTFSAESFRLATIDAAFQSTDDGAKSEGDGGIYGDFSIRLRR